MRICSPKRAGDKDKMKPIQTYGKKPFWLKIADKLKQRKGYFTIPILCSLKGLDTNEEEQ